MSWFRTVGRVLRKEFFSSWPSAILSLIAIGTAFLSANGVFLGLVKLETSLGLKQDSLFLAYLWTTFLCSAVLLAATMTLLQRLLRSHQEHEKASAYHDRASLVQHRMAEA